MFFEQRFGLFFPTTFRIKEKGEQGAVAARLYAGLHAGLSAE